MNELVEVPLEDEIGDVLEKALRRAEVNEHDLSRRTGISVSRIRDAIDYRPDFDAEELSKLAVALDLNEVGFCALGAGMYPLPEQAGLPFCVWPLRMRHGIGVVNAYLVGECGSTTAILFDTGSGMDSLEKVWPKQITQVSAAFVTHVEPEHAGALCEVVRRFGVASAYAPAGVATPCGKLINEGESVVLGKFLITAFATPGHCSQHMCYRVQQSGPRPGRSMLVSGDLLFAGSVGGAYFCHRQLQTHLRRVLSLVPEDTLIAPGHGPLTTVGNELKFNPFLG